MDPSNRVIALRSIAVAASVLALACSDDASSGTELAALSGAATPPTAAPDQTAPASPSAGPLASGERDWAALLEEVEPGAFDPLTVPMANGIVWYGTWEDAMAEKERTGKPVMVHFGSPRCPNGTVCVPGTW